MKLSGIISARVNSFLRVAAGIRVALYQQIVWTKASFFTVEEEEKTGRLMKALTPCGCSMKKALLFLCSLTWDMTVQHLQTVINRSGVRVVARHRLIRVPVDSCTFSDSIHISPVYTRRVKHYALEPAIRSNAETQPSVMVKPRLACPSTLTRTAGATGNERELSKAPRFRDTLRWASTLAWCRCRTGLSPLQEASSVLQLI